MKIELKLSIDALLACNEMMQAVYESQKPLSKENRIAVSIAFDVAEKIGTKTRSILKRQTLFDTKKQKITFKYHEAWALEEIIRSNVPNTRYSVYQNSLLTNIANVINQKIA